MFAPVLCWTKKKEKKKLTNRRRQVASSTQFHFPRLESPCWQAFSYRRTLSRDSQYGVPLFGASRARWRSKTREPIARRYGTGFNVEEIHDGRGIKVNRILRQIRNRSHVAPWVNRKESKAKDRESERREGGNGRERERVEGYERQSTCTYMQRDNTHTHSYTRERKKYYIHSILRSLPRALNRRRRFLIV